jgi:hypothetical protein
VWTSPFGRSYDVDADGYLATRVMVYPLVGRRMVLGADLPPSPSVLFRPFDDGSSALADGGEFIVSRLRDGQSEKLATFKGSGEASSFLLGPRRTISEQMMAFWMIEATARGATPAAAANLFTKWREVKQLTMKGELRPQDCLVAEIRINDNLTERAVVLLTNQPLVDVPLRGNIADTTKVPSC